MQHIPVPESDDELKAMMSVNENCKDLNDYLARFDLACALLQTKEALTICTVDLLTRLKEQGLIYAELRFAPQLSCKKGLSQEEAV